MFFGLAGLLWFASPVFAATNLIHRWSFTETSGITVADSVGGANGTLRQLVSNSVPLGSLPSLDGTQATLDGLGGYIDLPNGLVSGLTNVTIEAWFTWFDSGPNWQRIFDFGAISNTVTLASPLEDTNGTLRNYGTEGLYVGRNYLNLIAKNGFNGTMRLTATDGFNDVERPVLDLGQFPLPVGFELHVAVTYSTNGARLFYLGQEYASGAPANMVPLSAFQDINCWLGRSQFGRDALLAGSFNEFRIHNALLTQQELTASYQNGPDALNYNPGTVSFFTMTVANNLVVGFTVLPEFLAGFANAGILYLKPQDLSVYTSSNTNVVSINSLGQLVAVGPGSATITATVGGVTDTKVINVSASNPELKHRWSFNESPGATTVADSVGGANGTVVPGTNGTITLGGGEAAFPTTGVYNGAPFINLPAGIISSRTNVTIEMWATRQRSAGNQQRYFDFGSTTKLTPVDPGNGLTWLAFSPNIGSGTLQVTFSTTGNPAQLTLAGGALPPLNEEAHLTVVYAPESALSRIYYNGFLRSSGATPAALSALVDTNNNLGLSQFNDTPFGGKFNEFRIYEGLLTDLQIAVSRTAGPNTIVTNPGALLSISMPAQSLFVGNPTATQSSLLANFANISNVNIISISGVGLTSLNTNLFTTTAVGALTPSRSNTGPTGLRGTYSSLVTTGAVSVLAPTNLICTLSPTQYVGSPNATATLVAGFPDGSTNVNVTGYFGVTRTSSNTNVATITAAGVVTIVNLGTTTLTSSYGGLTNNFLLTVVEPPRLPAILAHRYSFGEAPGATIVTDSVGAANGTLVKAGDAADFNGGGQLNLVGGLWNGSPLPSYVDLPNGIISSLPSGSVTFEGWVTWDGPTSQLMPPIFWFGGTSVEGNPGSEFDYMVLSCRAPNGASPPNGWRFEIRDNPAGAVFNDGPPVFTVVPTNFHFAVVYDQPNGVLRVYKDGVRTQTKVATMPLSALADINVWLGRSGFAGSATAHNPWDGIYDEFRIYNGVMLDAEVAASYAAGPDVYNPLPLPPLEISLSGGNAVIQWIASAPASALLERTPLLGTGASWSTNAIPAPTVVGGKYQVTLPATDNYYYRLRK